MKADLFATDHPRQHLSFPSADELVSNANSDIRKQVTLFLDLPSEIIKLILIRLPVKPLSILKCVSKYFSGLISCKEFIREHFKLSSEDVSMSRYKVIIEGEDDYLNLKQTLFNSLCYESPVNFADLDYPGKESQEVVWLIRGSCNGLVLVIVNKECLVIWNPTTGKHNKLPTIVGYENLEGYVLRSPHCYCGFGFDVYNDDYKVVELLPLEREGSMSKRDYMVNVYSLKRNSWVRIPDFTLEELSDISGVFVSGNLHWCTWKGDIVSFDVAREVFGTLEKPNFVTNFYKPHLCVLGGSIAVCCDYIRRIDVWVMKEYGMVVSWTKMFTFSDYQYYAPPRPCYILPNGEVLNDDGSFDIYNPKTKSWLSTGVSFIADTVIYVESLVSPCCNEDERQS